MKPPEIAASSANKIILGDWIWRFNRGWLSRGSLRRNYKGKSLVVMLVGGDRSQGYRFPTYPARHAYWNMAPNPTNLRW